MKKKLKNIVRIFTLIGKYEPCYILCILPQIILSSVIPILYVYFPKLFIEQLTSGKNYTEIVWTVLIYVGILLVTGLLNAFISNKKTFYVDRFAKKIQFDTGSITMSLRLADMEGAEFSDKLALANNVTQIADMENVLQGIISNIITILGLASIIIRLDLLFVLLVCVTLLVKILFVCLTYRHQKKRRIEYAANNRIGNYLDSVAYFNHGAAKELRINSLKDWFMTKVRGYRNEMLELQYGDFRKHALFECISAVIIAVQSFVILSVLTMHVLEQTISIAEFTMYFSAVTVLTEKLSAIIVSIGEYSRLQLNIADYDILSEKEKTDTKHTGNAAVIGDIVFENVSFAYPNTNRFVLENINLRIRAGEKLSVVGENGAGKSTLIKLLCRFYRPTSGKITIGGVDIFDIEDDEYNKLIATVFQDFQNFAFTIKENVSVGGEDALVNQILADVGLEALINRLPEGSETHLTRQFNPNGIELSGGEGQKLAIARAICKNSPVLILDEPTAALDPKVESEIYESFFKIAKEKSVVFISHRLASSMIADKIVVLKDGKIAEYGSHQELLEAQKEYAKMFRMQSHSYVA